MSRQVVLAGIVSLLIIAAWSAGRAQATVANFEITVETARGPVKITCDKGCDWPTNEGALVCESEQCRWMFSGHGRIMLGQPR